MIAHSYEYLPQHQLLTKPIATHRLSLHSRKYVLVKMFDEYKNVIAMGELSPLPSFSHETLTQALTQLTSLLNTLSFPLQIQSLFTPNKTMPLFPSVKWCLFQLASYQTILNSSSTAMIKLAYLMNTLSNDELLHAKSKGFTSVKIKTDSKTNLLELLNKAHKENIKVRIDANGAWDNNSLPEILRFLDSLLPFLSHIEFIEDISLIKKRIIDIHRITPIPLAVDESFRTKDDLSFFIDNGIKFFILKPTLMKDVEHNPTFLNLQSTQNIITILSHAYDMHIGIKTLCHLAGRTTHNFAHGICFDYI